MTIPKHFRNVAEVVRWRLCLGCGSCAWVCPEKRIWLADFADEGIRPLVRGGECGKCIDCLAVCPAWECTFPPNSHWDGRFPRLGPEWGPVLEIWEGHACDPDVRFKGSSGGALTALSLYCLEQLGMKGVLHTGEDLNDPVRNRTRLSRSRDDLLAATGSRYSPASVCNGLNLIEAAGGECVFVGRPAEVASLAKASRIRHQLDRNVGAVFSFFCAETPATQGTLALLERLGVKSNSLRSVRYRGEGWPGHFSPVLKDQCEPAERMPYRESWAFLQSHRPWSVHLWPDSTGELADIVCGDPWYLSPDGKNPGISLVVVRTSRGKEIIRGAIEKGYLELSPAEPWKMIRSQEGLVAKKGAVWGRLLAMRLFGLPVPSFRGGNLFRCWLRLPAGEKAKSFLGTIRRIIQRKLYRPLTLDPEKGLPVAHPLWASRPDDPEAFKALPGRVA